MIHFVPDFLLPAGVQGRDRTYLKECISLAVLFIFCFLLNYFRGEPEAGVYPDFINTFRRKIHIIEMCPLCGSTRSFLFMCRGNILMAAHYSFFGIFFFCGSWGHLICKTLFLLRFRNRFLLQLLSVLDRYVIVLWTVFILWILQISLHFSGIFSWYTVREQTLFNFPV